MSSVSLTHDVFVLATSSENSDACALTLGIRCKLEVNHYAVLDIGVRINHDGTHVAVGMDLIGSDQGVNLFFDSTSWIFCRISASLKGQILS